LDGVSEGSKEAPGNCANGEAPHQHRSQRRRYAERHGDFDDAAVRSGDDEAAFFRSYWKAASVENNFGRCRAPFDNDGIHRHVRALEKGIDKGLQTLVCAGRAERNNPGEESAARIRYCQAHGS
jgi:hypothetical protein